MRFVYPLLLAGFCGFFSCIISSSEDPVQNTPSDDDDDTTSSFSFAIYNPTYDETSDFDDGVWEEEVVALQALVKHFGWSSTLLDYSDINQGSILEDEKPKYHAILAPGGWAWARNGDISADGYSYLNQYIQSGGGFVAFCAGSYWAADKVVFAENGTGDQNGFLYNRDDDYEGPYNYTWGLLPETLSGPFGWFRWNADGDNDSSNGVGNILFDVASIDTSIEAMKNANLPAQTRFVYGGGPWFPKATSDTLPGYEVWATAVAPSNIPDAAKTDGAMIGNAEPTIVHFEQGDGNVILFAYHPDILIDSMVDNVVLSTYYNEQKMIDEDLWNLGDQSYDDINYDSWNIVHAAMQVAVGEDVTPIDPIE